MSDIERCVHQVSDGGNHLLFKEQWERCKNCAYDPENNKKCSGYSPIVYSTSENILESKLSVFYSISQPDLSRAIA
ncbi:MAG TPA: hypothetical protein PK357_02915 [Candidatus Pacearchaeota archaeon]|nr:hypothetical protein [Candidatus Pacearchaeota archaeon]